ncbi:type II secretion system protein [Oleiharenicola lentus]|uniref:type II secretion system protein n=1 Tax=Oleiharenicola lentus TaxID=2508720 RepID=UPI003F66EC16
MPSRPPAERNFQTTRKARGFTLLELLAVLTIIGVLSAIVIGVGRHAATASKVARAKAELAALAAALEAYKRQYGDYPRIASDDSLDDVASCEQLHLALSGQRGSALNAPRILPQQRILFERSRFTMADLRAPDDALQNHFVDPWGQSYRYAYKPAGNTWTNSAYILVSAGPDENLTLPLPTTGNIDATYEAATRDSKPVNTDNIYADRN